MIPPDVNVILEAFRTVGPRHDRCKEWREAVVSGENAYGISPQVLSSAVRNVTNPRAYLQRDPIGDILGFCNELLDHPHCHVILPGPRHWRVFTDLCRDVGATGNLVADAWSPRLQS